MRDRESSAVFTSKYGFSVVAPTSTRVRFSDGVQQGVLLGAVEAVDLVDEQDGAPAHASSRSSAALISRRRSLTVPPMAETSTNSACVVLAMMCAMEVLPVPAGPNRMTLESTSCSMARRSHESGPTACCCPTSSSSVRGRMRTASGAFALRVFSVAEKIVSMASGFLDVAAPPLCRLCNVAGNRGRYVRQSTGTAGAAKKGRDEKHVQEVYGTSSSATPSA